MAIKFDVRQIAGQIRRTHVLVAAVAVAVLGIGYYAGTGESGSDVRGNPPAPPPLPLNIDLPLSDKARKEAEFLARASMLYVFFHEAGHMAISELKIPATGPEEDVVDEFAMFVLTDAMKAARDEEKGFFANIAWAGIQLNNLWAQERDVSQIDWADEHSPSQRRYYSMLCIATGADPVRFIPIAVAAGVDQGRLLRCDMDYKTKHAAWDTLMAPHVPGFWARLAGSGKLLLKVGEAMKPEWLAFEKAWTNGDVFQKGVLDPFSSVVKLPRDIPVIVKGCGKINAWWSPSEGTITLCHDYFQRTLEMFARDEARREQQAQQQQGGGQPGGGGQGGGQPGGGTPAPPAPAGAMTAEQLVGTWTCQGQTAAGFARETTTLLRDGSFRSSSVAANMSFQASGRWSLQDGNTIRYDVTASSMPPAMNPILVPFQVTGPNSINANGLACQKTGA